MLYLKKYFIEGLIQFTILLSLIGVRVDVDSYLSGTLPPLRESILGPSSALAQTHSHHLRRNTLDGYGIHPKSADLHRFFATRRLLNQVRQLDRLAVPRPQLDAWLVHRDAAETTAAVSAGSQSGPGSAPADNGAGLEDAEGPADATAPAMRGGGNAAPDSTYDPNAANSSLGAAAPRGGRDANQDLTKEDIDLIDILWRQDVDLGAEREVFNYSNRQKESEEEEEEEEEKPRPPTEDKDGSEESRRNSANLQEAPPVDGETGESITEQLPALGSQTSLSLQECLRLLEATFPFGEEAEFASPVAAPEVPVCSEEAPSTSQGGATGSHAPSADPPLDLEQQWQDIMAVMELQAMDVTSLHSASSGVLPVSETSDSSVLGSYGVAPPRPPPLSQDVSLHAASVNSSSVNATSSSGVLRLSSTNSSRLNASFGATNLTGLFLPPPLANVTAAVGVSDPFSSLLEEAMLDEISLLDLAMEEGFSAAAADQLEEELDSDSGLSLDSSPASPSSSETSCCSAASSSSTSATFSEEGAVGYSTDSEVASAEPEEAGGGGGGGYQPGYSKLCRMSYQDPAHFHTLPQLHGAAHNHTYNLPLSSPFSEPSPPPHAARKKSVRDKACSKLAPPPQDFLDKHASRDECRARALKIPFSNEKIINLPVEEFNELLAKHHLSEPQLALIRDIRRRGKNKLAAQNCRKRKLDTIIHLEQDVTELRRHKARLLKEKMEFLRSLRQTKQKMQSLYQDVFAQLRDHEGRPYPPSQYSLQHAADGSVLVMPRSNAAVAGGAGSGETSQKPVKKQKDKKK